MTQADGVDLDPDVLADPVEPGRPAEDGDGDTGADRRVEGESELVPASRGGLVRYTTVARAGAAPTARRARS